MGIKRFIRYKFFAASLFSMFSTFATMKHLLSITTLACALLFATCSKPVQVAEKANSQACSTVDSLRADSIYNVAQTFFQNALDYRDKDSTVAYCKEYYRILEILEEHFSVIQPIDVKQLTKQDKQIIHLLKKTYKGLGTDYSVSLLPDPSSYFYRQALAIDKKYSNSPAGLGTTLFLIAYGFDISDRFDSACYYYDTAIRCFDNDSTDLLFRMSISRNSVIDYKLHHNAESVISDLKALLLYCDETDRHDVEFAIGWIYKEEQRFDSALFYLNRAFDEFEQSGFSNTTAKLQTLEYLHEVYEALGDTGKMNECAHLLAQYPHAIEAFAPVTSELTELYNNYMQKKQEADMLLQKQQAQRHNILIVSLVVLAILVLGLLFMFTHKRHKQTEANLREAHQQQREAINQQLSEAQTALKQKTFNDLTEKAKACFTKNPGRSREPILNAFNKVYPEAYDRLKSTYPNLTDKERDLLVLNFLQFRIKEEAEILDLSENTVMKYRSDLIKKVGKSPISDLLV